MTGAVILAAGHGQIRPDQTKLLEPSHDQRMILQAVVENVKAAGRFNPLVVVINGRFGDEIKCALESAGHRDLVFVHQCRRLGAADAFSKALPALHEAGAQHALGVFGDMPLLQSGLMAEMVAFHQTSSDSAQPDLTISSWPYDPEHPLARYMDNYAYIADDAENGRPMVSLYTGHPPIRGADVLSSLYVVCVAWFERVFPLIQPMDKGDGFGSEKHMPKLLELAESERVCNLRRPIANQIIGVNTAADLQLIKQLALSKVVGVTH